MWHTSAPSLGAIAIGLGFLPWLYWKKELQGGFEAGFRVMFLLQFIQFAINTSVIVDAYDLAVHVGQSASFSGLVMSIFMVGYLFASASLSLVMMRCTTLWCRYPKALFIAGVSCSLAGSVVYAASMSLPSSKMHSSLLSMLVLTSRFIGGFGAGISEKISQVAISKGATLTDRPEYMVRFLFATMLGIGFGPLLSSFQHTVNQCESYSGPHFWQLGMMSAILLLFLFFAICVTFPNTLENKDVANGKDVNASICGTEKICSQKRILVCGCLAMSVLRGYLVTSLEAATALFLEKDHDWNKSTIGLVVSLTFLCCVPFKVLHKKCSSLLKVQSWVRLFSAGAILATILISVKQSWALLLADCLLFPCIYIADALSRGIMMQNLLPTGSLFDANLASFWAIFFGATGQALGPWFTRWYIDLTGRNLYAVQQCLGVAIFLALFELIVRPRSESILRLEQGLKATEAPADLEQGTPCPKQETLMKVPSVSVPSLVCSDCNLNLTCSKLIGWEQDSIMPLPVKTSSNSHITVTSQPDRIHLVLSHENVEQRSNNEMVNAILPDNLTPVGVILNTDLDTSLNSLVALDAAGVRGVFVNLQDLEQEKVPLLLKEIGLKISSLQWHIHLCSDLQTLLKLGNSIRESLVPVVIECKPSSMDLMMLRLDQKAFDSILTVLQEAKCRFMLPDMHLNEPREANVNTLDPFFIFAEAALATNSSKTECGDSEEQVGDAKRLPS